MSREEHVKVPPSEDVLQRFGYQPEFRRELKRFASFAVGFSVISAMTGVFTLYGTSGILDVCLRTIPEPMPERFATLAPRMRSHLPC